jgi:hypothetical protein
MSDDEDRERREHVRAEQERRFLEQQPLRRALEALRVYEQYIRQIAEMDPILHTEHGDRCAFGCGFGAWDTQD